MIRTPASKVGADLFCVPTQAVLEWIQDKFNGYLFPSGWDKWSPQTPPSSLSNMATCFCRFFSYSVSNKTAHLTWALFSCQLANVLLGICPLVSVPLASLWVNTKCAIPFCWILCVSNCTHLAFSTTPPTEDNPTSYRGGSYTLDQWFSTCVLQPFGDWMTISQGSPKDYQTT